MVEGGSEKWESYVELPAAGGERDSPARRRRRAEIVSDDPAEDVGHDDVLAAPGQVEAEAQLGTELEALGV